MVRPRGGTRKIESGIHPYNEMKCRLGATAIQISEIELLTSNI